MSDRVLKCYNCGGEGHFAKDCTSGTHHSIQNELTPGPTPTEEIGTMTGATTEAKDLKGLEAMAASTAASPDILPETALSPGRSDKTGPGEKSPEDRREVSADSSGERVPPASTVRRVGIWPETAKPVEID
jgi:hypothetical protein